MQSGRRFISLESLRGIGAVIVVYYHSRLFSDYSYSSLIQNGAFVLMDFFFILSGFVMAYSYAQKIGNEVTFKTFLILRFARLYPLHLFTLLLWIPYILIKVVVYINGVGDTNPSEHNNVQTLLLNIFLLHGIDGNSALSWNYPAWSISVEFYTYLFFYLIMWVLPRPSASTISVAMCMAISIASYSLLYFLHRHFEIFLFECIGGFFLGVCVYQLYSKLALPQANAWMTTALEMFALAFLWYCMSKLEKHAFDDPLFYLTLFALCMLIFIFVIQTNGHISRLLHVSFIQHLGKISYSIYMLHAIILASAENSLVYFLKFDKTSFGELTNVLVFKGASYANLALLVLIIALSTLSYKYVEMPLKRRFAKFATK